jgi:glucokinase
VTERAIGIDVGGTKIAAGVVDRDGKILSRVERPTPTESRDEFLEVLDEMVDQLRGDGIAAIGFGLPSTIDQRTGRVIGSVHVPLADFDFRDHAAERFSVPVALDNDGNAAAIAEWTIGAGKGSDHMIMLTLGTGVGGGLILDG